MHAGYPLADNVGGLFGALGVMAALWRRARDPDAPGEEIDLSLVESTLKLLEFLPIEHQQLGVVRQRSGNANQYSAPAAVYRQPDARWVTLAGSTNALFAANCRAIGRPDLLDDDPRFASNAQRVQHAAELNALFGPGAPAAAGRRAAGLRAPPAAPSRRSTTSTRSRPTRRCRRARRSATCPTQTSAACAWPPWCRALHTTPAPSAAAATPSAATPTTSCATNCAWPTPNWQRCALPVSSEPPGDLPCR
jgi:crotonobetainyl-CoA:carnitine CoA-transferase CaiB-like acyl-CoA transferase